ncbi:MAG: hypothetical protein PHY85_00845, partial [Bacteroidales bacterium]|nr:hypothetical protein [Bacteroidales bacterium]
SLGLRSSLRYERDPVFGGFNQNKKRGKPLHFCIQKTRLKASFLVWDYVLRFAMNVIPFLGASIKTKKEASLFIFLFRKPVSKRAF